MEAIHREEQRINRIRFSITELLWIAPAVGAALLFSRGLMPGLPRQDSPFQSGALIALAVVSGLILLFSYGAVSGKTWKSRSAAIGVFSLLLFFAGVFSWHQISWFILGIVVSVILCRVDRSRTLHLQLLVGWLVASSLCGGLLNYCFPSARVRNLLAAREAYPIEDLSTRLVRFSNKSAPIQQTPIAQLESHFYKTLIPFFADPSTGNRRTVALQQLHDREYEMFVKSMGFGAFRMTTVSRRKIDLPEIVNIGFDETEQDLKSNHYLLTRWVSKSNQAEYEFGSELSSFPDLLQRSYLDFVNPATFGWVAASKNVAGFEPHAFRFSIPQVSIKSKSYSIRRLELIGLLVSEPRVYVMDHLPRMDQISKSEVPTRSLNEFELSALQKLFAGEDLVVDEQPNRIKMVGALRSFESCASCHDSATGDLMGAFSYELEAK